MSFSAISREQPGFPLAPPTPGAGNPVAWPLWQRVLFRFFFVYLLLQIQPWNWLRAIPGVPYLFRPWFRFMAWAVYASNERLFHVAPELVAPNGSGDTTYIYAQLLLFITV